MTTAAPAQASIAPIVRMVAIPRIITPAALQNLAGTFLPRGFTVNRAGRRVNQRYSPRFGDRPSDSTGVLPVVLAAHDACDVAWAAAIREAAHLALVPRRRP